MAWSLNAVQLIGNVGKDPEIRTSQNGNKIVNLSVATSESWTDKQSGERKERTEWHRVVIFNERVADVVERYVKKGSKIYIEGSLQTRKWQDKSGNDRYSTEVVIQNFRGNIGLLDGRQQGDGDGGGQQRQQVSGGSRQPSNLGGTSNPSYGGQQQRGGGGQTNYTTQTPSNGPSWGGAGGGDLDDEIPF